MTQMTKITLCAIIALAMQLGNPAISFGIQGNVDVNVADQRAEETVEAQQDRILKNYAELEQKLLSLREFEKDNNPARSKLLQKAYELSQEQSTTDNLKDIVKLLNSGELQDAESNQKRVLADMNRLLALLQSENRSKRIEDDIKRNQAYRKEVERLLRNQKSLRAQTKSAMESGRIAKSQQQAADRAKKLGRKIRENEELESQDFEGLPNNDVQPSGGEESQNGGPSDEPKMNPVRQRIEAAEKRMRDAKKKLDEAERAASIDDMNEAIRQLESAKEALDEILRQLREEEVQRTLSGLEGRFRKMMEREIKLNDTTKSMSAVVPEQRLADFEIKAGKLATEQSAIASEASRALLLLREDGSSVAFPQTVQELQLDMEQVASRLSASKLDEMTLAIQSDIIETLGYLTEALSKAQRENDARQKKSGQGKSGGRAGESSLVGKIAEIRMLRALQDRIFRRHSRYSKMLDNPDDIVGGTRDPEIRAALERLTVKQAQLTNIAKKIVDSMND